MPKATYWTAKEVQEIAEDLIPLYHQHLIDCAVKIVYNFTDKISKTNGKEQWVKVLVVNNFNAYLANQQTDSDPFFAIQVPHEIWELLSQDQKIAYVDWALTHCHAEVVENDEENPIKISRRPYDIQDYSCIARRHGYWREDVADFISNALASQKSVSTPPEAIQTPQEMN